MVNESNKSLCIHWVKCHLLTRVLKIDTYRHLKSTRDFTHHSIKIYYCLLWIFPVESSSIKQNSINAPHSSDIMWHKFCSPQQNYGIFNYVTELKWLCTYNFYLPTYLVISIIWILNYPSRVSWGSGQGMPYNKIQYSVYTKTNKQCY